VPDGSDPAHKFAVQAHDVEFVIRIRKEWLTGHQDTLPGQHGVTRPATHVRGADLCQVFERRRERAPVSAIVPDVQLTVVVDMQGQPSARIEFPGSFARPPQGCQKRSVLRPGDDDARESGRIGRKETTVPIADYARAGIRSLALRIWKQADASRAELNSAGDVIQRREDDRVTGRKPSRRWAWTPVGKGALSGIEVRRAAAIRERSGQHDDETGVQCSTASAHTCTSAAPCS
jgi:hypothetical protein